MQTTCKVCGGTYETVQGNTRYFHACAPVADAVTVKRGDTVETVKPDAVQATDDVLTVTTVERPNKVDENLPLTKGR